MDGVASKEDNTFGIWKIDVMKASNEAMIRRKFYFGYNYIFKFLRNTLYSVRQSETDCQINKMNAVNENQLYTLCAK